MKKTENSANYWGNLFATWIIASNDDQPIIFYDGLKRRLGVDHVNELKEMVDNNRELFRRVSHGLLDRYKERYLEDLRRCPTWMKEQYSGEELRKFITNLDNKSAFASQFRYEYEAQKTDKDILEWGINYIERKWKLYYEYKKEKQVIWTSIVIPIISLLIAALAIIIGKS